MTDPLRFTVNGSPTTQGSHRAMVSKHGKPFLLDSAGQKLKDWRRAMTDAAVEAMNGRLPMSGPLAVRVVFRLRAPKHPASDYPATRPDLDKLVRCLDALTDAKCWNDDGQVVQIAATKRYATAGEPLGCDIEVRALGSLPPRHLPG